MEADRKEYAAEVEQYLKEQIGTFSYASLIRDIRVSPCEKGLEVRILSGEKAVIFKPVQFRVKRGLSEKAWINKRKEIIGNLRHCQPETDPDVLKGMEEEAGRKLEKWRKEHPFNQKMKDFLSSDAAAAYFSRGDLLKLCFLEENEELTLARCVAGKDHLTVFFREIPLQAVYDFASGKIRVYLTGVSPLYRQLAALWKDHPVKKAIETYLQEKGWRGSVRYRKKPGAFTVCFLFDRESVEEEITVRESYRRIVSAAYRRAQKRAEERKKEKKEQLKKNPFHGSCLAQAVMETIMDRKGYVTARQIVHILRGTNLDKGTAAARHAGRYSLLEPEEISAVINGLEGCGLIRSRYVHGEYQNYYIYRLNPDGYLLDEMMRGSRLKNNPVTEQEYLLYMRAVRDNAKDIQDKRKKDILKLLAESPAVFLTDPEVVLDCMEGMGETAAAFFKSCMEKEENKKKKKILKLLWSAASGNGKNLPQKSGLAGFLDREEKKRRRAEEVEKKDRELMAHVLTEIPERYADLYPAARKIKRHFLVHVGPTNSGKTHDAVRDLMKAENGIYLGLLRLLAHEMFEWMNGEDCPCSLVTGEEQIMVGGAVHQSSTIEMADLRKWYHTAVIDEAQMISDPDRGGAWAAAMMGLCALRIHVCTAPEGEKCLTEIISECGDDFEIIRHSRMTPLVFEDQIFHFPEDVREGDALIVFSRVNHPTHSF